MTKEQLMLEVRDSFDIGKVSMYQGFIAIQVNLTDEGMGCFYIELKDKHVSVEPYDYYDRNAAITISSLNMINVLNRRLDPVIAFTKGELKVEGDPGKVLELLTLTR